MTTKKNGQKKNIRYRKVHSAHGLYRMPADLDAAAFSTHFANYVQVMACKTIGDSTQYTKHLQRRGAEGDASALAQTAALSFFADIETQVQQVLAELETLGQDRIIRVCAAICQEPALPLMRVHAWGLCALSGIPSNNMLQIGSGEGALLLALEFEAFATAFWVVQHISILEKSRAAAFANSSAENATIADIVTAYCEQAQDQDMCDLYRWAFGMVLGTLAATKERLNDYLREVARV
jgi:hypothetical protein